MAYTDLGQLGKEWIYNDFGTWIRRQLDCRVQKISIDAGFTCPNRDGKVGKNGCIYCDNRTFNPSYCHHHDSVKLQLEKGKQFFSAKYPDMNYLAYFQAYSNTYAPVERLQRLYEEALDTEDIVGLIIATRPDCINDETLGLLQKLSRQTFLIVEYGVETFNEKTLQRINRGHDTACSRKAIEQTALRGITTGIHLIVGLPGEDKEESIRQAEIVSSLPVKTLKLHQLQIIKGTKLAQEYSAHPFHVYSPSEYIEFIGEYLQHLREDIIVDRFVSQSPKDLLIAPDWGLKNHEFTNLLNNYLRKNGIRQGKLCTQHQSANKKSS